VISCLIVDDDRSFLRVARVLLEREGLRVAGVASKSADALCQVKALRPDVVLPKAELSASAIRRVVDGGRG
jgi:CheY-like chemotaxis protein